MAKKADYEVMGYQISPKGEASGDIVRFTISATSIQEAYEIGKAEVKKVFGGNFSVNVFEEKGNAKTE